MAEIVIKYSELVALLGSDERREIEALADCPAAIKRLLAELDRIVVSMSEPLEDLSQIVPILVQLFSILRHYSDLSPELFCELSSNIFDNLVRSDSTNSASFFEAGIIAGRKSDLILFLSEHFSAEVFTVERLSELLDVLGNEEFDEFVRHILPECEFKKDGSLLDAAIGFIKKEHTTQSASKFLLVYSYLQSYNLLNQDRLFFLMSLPSDAEIKSLIKVISKLGLDWFHKIPTLIDQVLEHKHLKEMGKIFSSYIETIDERILHALFSHRNIPALLAALENYKQFPSELISLDNLLLVLKNPNPSEQVESLRADALRKISEAAISPVDVMGNAVTDKPSGVTRLDNGVKSPDAQAQAKAAASIIRDRVRILLHAKRLNRMSLFSNSGKYTRSRAMVIPEILAKKFPDEFKPDALFLTTTHATSQLHNLLHDGRLYPMNVTKKEGVSIASDYTHGDGMMVFTSPSHNLYDQPQHIVFHVDRMFDAHSGNRGQNALFKLVDWAVLDIKEGYAYPYTEIMPNLNLRLMRLGGKLVWEVVYGSSRYEVELPQEAYVFHGKQGLNKYLSFFLFKVFEDKTIPASVSTNIYLELSRFKPEVIIERFHNVIQNCFYSSELDYLGKFELNFMMLSSFQLSETQQINCDVIRNMIDRNDFVNIEALFSDLETRQLFSQSYFLVKGMYDYAVEKEATAIITFIEGAFENTLRLSEKLPTDSAADSADGSAVPPVLAAHLIGVHDYEYKAGGSIGVGGAGSDPVHHLLSAEGEQVLVDRSVTPSEVNLFVNHLLGKRAEVVANLNRNPITVQHVLAVCEKTFGSIKEITSLGLVSTLIKHVVADPDFQALLKNHENCKILLYLAATQGNLAGLTLDEALIEKLRAPLFNVRNGFTGTRIKANFWGLENQEGVHANTSLLADLIFNVPPQWLFVPQNAVNETENPAFNSELIQQRVSAYSSFFDNIRSLIDESGVKQESRAAHESVICANEVYDDRKWREYKAEFQSLESRCRGYSILDAESYKSQAIDSDGFIESDLVLNAFFCHDYLDPAHLRSLLGSGWAFMPSLYRVMDIQIAQGDSAKAPTDQQRMVGLQLFRRLQLLKYELAKSAHLSQLSAHPVALSKTMGAPKTCKTQAQIEVLDSQNDFDAFSAVFGSA